MQKKIHPDKFKILNLSQEEEDIVQKGFAKLTSDFNTIKTADKRQNLETKTLLEKEKSKNKVNEMITNATELLHKGYYLKAGKVINTIKINHPEINHKMLPLVSLWHQLKSKKPVNINEAKRILDNYSGTEKTSLEYYLNALLCKTTGDSEGFVKNLQISTQIDNSFLPTRREFVQFKSEMKKAQNTKKLSNFGTLFTSKKS